MRFLLACLALLPLACSKGDAPPPEPVKQTAPDPGRGVSVKKAKERASGEEVIVEGRVSSIVQGVEAFTLVDDELAYCGRHSEEGCKTPWDYCCIDSATRAAATLSVEVRGADGKVRAGKASSLRLLDLVAVKGKVEKDEHGNVTIVETSRFVRERPKLADDLHWPQ